jgi:hypothetical protein
LETDAPSGRCSTAALEDNNMSAKRIIGTIAQAIACISGISLIAVALWAYLVDHYDPATGAYFDGFGRQLYGNIGIFGRNQSPGLIWELVDSGIAIVAFVITTSLFSFGTKLKRTSQKERDK